MAQNICWERGRSHTNPVVFNQEPSPLPRKIPRILLIFAPQKPAGNKFPSLLVAAITRPSLYEIRSVHHGVWRVPVTGPLFHTSGST